MLIPAQHLPKRDKPVILILGDSAVVHTGYAQVIRGIFSRLGDQFNLIQLGWNHVTAATSCNWKIISTLRYGNQCSCPVCAKSRGMIQDDDRYGAISFHQVTAEIRPDIVFAVGDPQTFVAPALSHLRPQYRLVLYVAIDNPFGHPSWKPILSRANYLYSFGPYGRCVIERDVKVPVHGEIPHGVDTSVFSPVSQERRAEIRSRLFNLGPEGRMIGYVGRNIGRKRVDQLLVGFSAFAKGQYVTCRRCHRVSTFEFDESSAVFLAPSSCRRCLARGLTPGVLHPEYRLYLHTPPADQGPDLETLTEHLGIHGLVLGAANLQIGSGVPEQLMADIYRSFDIYASCGTEGWGLPLSEAMACGVPAVVAGASAHLDYCRAGSIVVPPIEWVGEDRPRAVLKNGRVDGRSPALRPILDTGALVEAFLRLMDSGERSRLGAAARKAIEPLTWDSAASRWREVFLTSLRSSVTSAGLTTV